MTVEKQKICNLPLQPLGLNKAVLNCTKQIGFLSLETLQPTPSLTIIQKWLSTEDEVSQPEERSCFIVWWYGSRYLFIPGLQQNNLLIMYHFMLALHLSYILLLAYHFHSHIILGNVDNFGISSTKLPSNQSVSCRITCNVIVLLENVTLI